MFAIIGEMAAFMLAGHMAKKAAGRVGLAMVKARVGAGKGALTGRWVTREFLKHGNYRQGIRASESWLLGRGATASAARSGARDMMRQAINAASR